MNNFLVLGGTGFLGLSVCERLVERTGSGDARVVVPTRHPQRGAHLLPLPIIEVAPWNPDDDAQLDRLVHRRDAVINLVGVLHGSEAEFRRMHADLPARLARACAAQGVPRIVHVSALGADAGAPSMYLRSKAAGEAALLGGPVDTVILRPSGMVG